MAFNYKNISIQRIYGTLTYRAPSPFLKTWTKIFKKISTYKIVNTKREDGSWGFFLMYAVYTSPFETRISHFNVVWQASLASLLHCMEKLLFRECGKVVTFSLPGYLPAMPLCSHRGTHHTVWEPLLKVNHFNMCIIKPPFSTTLNNPCPEEAVFTDMSCLEVATAYVRRL